jgi:hypothetical protein
MKACLFLKTLNRVLACVFRFYRKLANLIRICGFLMQTKVYLFWREERKRGLWACFPVVSGWDVNVSVVDYAAF